MYAQWLGQYSTRPFALLEERFVRDQALVMRELSQEECRRLVRERSAAKVMERP